VSTRPFGILATLVGSAIVAWWVMNQRRTRNATAPVARRVHGTVIFDNTPSAANTDRIR
jgi:hypothetical protein